MTARMALVPICPDEAMLFEGVFANQERMVGEVYVAMLNAAPAGGKVTREMVEKSARAMCEANGVKPDEPIYFGTEKTALQGMTESLVVGLTALGLEVSE